MADDRLLWEVADPCPECGKYKGSHVPFGWCDLPEATSQGSAAIAIDSIAAIIHWGERDGRADSDLIRRIKEALEAHRGRERRERKDDLALLDALSDDPTPPPVDGPDRGYSDDVVFERGTR